MPNNSVAQLESRENMVRKARLFGHPAHLRLIGLPLVLFLATLVLDVLHSISRNPLFAQSALWIVRGGACGALLETMLGFQRTSATHAKMHVRQLARLYSIFNLLLVLLFALSGVVRYAGGDFASSEFLLLLSYVGILLGILTLWLGSEIIYGVPQTATQRRANRAMPTTPAQHLPTYGQRSA